MINYETFNNSLDQLLEQESRQGLRLRILIRPFKLASLGLSGTYKVQKENVSPTKNLRAYFNFARLPFLKSSLSISQTYLDTYYLNSNITGIRLNKDFFKGKLSGGLQYRFVNYQYLANNSTINQHITGISINWRLIYQLSLSLTHEITFGESNNYHRTYLRLIKRIKH